MNEFTFAHKTDVKNLKTTSSMFYSMVDKSILFVFLFNKDTICDLKSSDIFNTAVTCPINHLKLPELIVY